MARVEFVDGIQCKKCGNMIAQPTIFTKERCQKCGAKLMDVHVAERNYSLTEYGEEITIKRTHKLFHNILERVD